MVTGRWYLLHMTERRVSATQFKARCLALMHEVARTGHALLITKRKQDLVRVVRSAPPASLRGSVKVLISEDELLAPIELPWEANR